MKTFGLEGEIKEIHKRNHPTLVKGLEGNIAKVAFWTFYTGKYAVTDEDLEFVVTGGISLFHIR